MKSIFIILDYKDRFETKFTAEPYRSGFNKDLVQKYFFEYGYEIQFIKFFDINFRNGQLKDKIFLYCSSEDQDGFYKSYIEDIILGLKLAGAIVIPDYLFLKAHNNKLFMEILRDIYGHNKLKNLKSYYFGTLEDLKLNKNLFESGRFVIKPAMGAMSKNVSCGSGFDEIFKQSKKISKTPFYLGEIKDFLRKFKYPGYVKDSKNRRKIIVQNMIGGLEEDWKILIYDDKYYPLKRKNRKNDFRASGGGLLSYARDLPDGLLSFAKTVYESFNGPNLSIDVGFNGKAFYLFEFQALYFGTYAIEKSEFYFMQGEHGWEIHEERSILEKEYARSVCAFIKRLTANENTLRC